MFLLRELDDFVQAHPGQPLPRSLALRLHEAREKAENGASLACALGCDLRRRDAALRRAADLLDPMGHESRRVDRVLRAVERARAPGWRPQSEADHAIGAALAAGSIPNSDRQIRNILKSGAPDFQNRSLRERGW